MKSYRFPNTRFAVALPDVPDVTELRVEIRAAAARLMRIDYQLECEPFQSAESLESIIRSADLPFVHDAFIREQLRKAQAS